MTQQPEYPPHALAAEILTGGETTCSFCHQAVVKGKTNRGRHAMFDPEPPYLNHWISCPKRKVAERYYKAKRKGTGGPR